MAASSPRARARAPRQRPSASCPAASSPPKSSASSASVAATSGASPASAAPPAEVGPGAEAGVLGFLSVSPLSMASVQVVSAAFGAYLLAEVGRIFGGTGRFADALLAVG